MLRNTILLALCVVLNVGQLEADERPDKAWTKYLEGSWTYEISDGTKGSAVWTYEADGRGVRIEASPRTLQTSQLGLRRASWDLCYCSLMQVRCSRRHCHRARQVD